MAAQPLTEAAPITFRAGHAVITLFKVHDGFHVQVMQGTQRVDEWSCSYPDEPTARAEARRAAKAFDTWGTADQVAQAYDRTLDKAEHWRLRRGEFAKAQTTKFEAEADALQPLRGRAADQELAAQIVATIHAAATVQVQPPAQRRRMWSDLRAEFATTHPSN